MFPERFLHPMHDLGWAGSLLIEGWIRDGPNYSQLGNGAGRPTIRFVTVHPGAHFAVEGMTLPKASNQDVDIEKPWRHSLSSSILRACSRVIGSESSSGEKM